MTGDERGSGPLCLVTGATGYIGGRLVPELLEAGLRVRCLARSPDRLRDHPWAGAVEVVRGDVTDAESVAQAMRGVDVGYYLVHALGTGKDFEETDRRAARIFGERAHAAGVQPARVPGRSHAVRRAGAELSPHLRSRAEVGRILLDCGVPTAVLRAAVVIGSGSASFEMLRYLTERLPVMVTPSWVHTRIQPVAVRDVLRALVGCARLPDDVSRTFDIGGPDVLTYREMMRRYAAVAGLPHRLILSVPVLSPGLSSHWVGLVTPVPASIARPLTESLRHEVVCREHDIARYVADPPGHPVGFDEAVRLALRRVREARVTTRWSSASLPGAPSDPLPTDPDWAGGSLYTDRRELRVDAPARPCGGSSRASVVTTAGTPSRSPGPYAGGWTGWRAGWACAGAAGTPHGCGWATRWTSGGSRRSSRGGCCGCGRRCGCRAWRGWRCTRTRTTRDTPCCVSVPCSIRAGCSVTRTGGAWPPSTPSCSAAWPATSHGRPWRTRPPGRGRGRPCRDACRACPEVWRGGPQPRPSAPASASASGPCIRRMSPAGSRA